MSQKKVLIISYYWPPSGGGGVQRWLKFSKYLPEFGWQPTLYTPENPDFHQKDASLLQDVSPEVRVIKRKIWEPYRWLGGSKRKQGVVGGKKKGLIESLMIWIRGNFFIPDPRVFWVKPSVSFLKKRIAEEGIEYIVTTGPPQSMHLIGLGLKKHFGARVKWLVDFRDVWSAWDILDTLKTSKWAKRKHQRLEKKVTDNADHLVYVNRQGADLVVNPSGTPLTVITNGFDPEDFHFTKNTRPPAESFTLSHFGLLNDIRNPVALWEALNSLCAENEAFRKALKVRLGGMVSDNIIHGFDQYPYLKERIQLEGYLSHDEVIEAYQASDILLLLINQTALGQKFMTGKIFEYLPAGRWVLCVGGENSDAADVLSRTNLGTAFSHADTNGIRKWLWQKYENRVTPTSSENEVVKYSRKDLTRQLTDVLDKM